MYCTSCGEAVSSNDQFCKSCGKRIIQSGTSTPKEHTQNVQMTESTGNRFVGILVTVVSLAFGYYVGTTIGILGVILIYGPILAGAALGNWYFKRYGIRTKLISRLAWLCLLTWLLPPLGLFSSAMILAVVANDKPTNRKLVFLGAIGIMLSLVNSLVGAAIR